MVQPSNAGDAGSIPCRGAKVPQATGQLNLSVATTEPAPQLEKPTRHNQREACDEEPACRNEDPMQPKRKRGVGGGI